MGDSKLQAEIDELRLRLEEAEATLSAIRNGEVDALVVGGSNIYTLEGADHPYRVLVEAMPHGAVTLSPSGSIVYCNSGFAEMLGRPAEQIIGEQIEHLFSAADQTILQEGLANDQIVKQVELTLKTDYGTRMPVIVSFNRLPLDGISALCLVISDLSEHKQNEKLQDSDRRKDEFLAMLAHELRNPLAPIANATQILSLENQSQNSGVQWACDIIDRQVRQMTRIVDDLLDVSRITRGKIKLQKAPHDLAAIVAAAVETSRPLIESRKHRLHISLATETLRVEADFTRMAQVITNLLNNAAKYTEEGGEISLGVQRSGSDATITVRDNGVGISPDVLPEVFDLFAQADRTIDRSQGGLGIGLTLVRSLVDLHRGAVEVSSEGLGRGSTFVVRLPLIVDSSRNHPVTAEDKTSGSPITASQRILVVDDNVDSALTMAMALKAMGHQCAISHDGSTAIDTAKRFKPSLILLDIGLPGMNGYVVAEHLRAAPELNGVVLAALTGYGEEQDRRRSQNAGFDQHFVKPVSFTVLQGLIASLAER